MPGKRENYITFDEYFMGIADLSTYRSKDPKTQVGACLVDEEHHILSVGYNGLVLGMNDDSAPWSSIGEETGNIMEIKNTFVVHAEVNAIVNFYGDHSKLKNSTLYVTLSPCVECSKVIIQSGIRRVIFKDWYYKEDQVQASLYMFDLAGVECIQYETGKIVHYTGIDNIDFESEKLNWTNPYSKITGNFMKRNIEIEYSHPVKMKAKYR